MLFGLKDYLSVRRGLCPSFPLHSLELFYIQYVSIICGCLWVLLLRFGKKWLHFSCGVFNVLSGARGKKIIYFLMQKRLRKSLKGKFIPDYFWKYFPVVTYKQILWFECLCRRHQRLKHLKSRDAYALSAQCVFVQAEQKYKWPCSIPDNLPGRLLLCKQRMSSFDQHLWIPWGLCTVAPRRLTVFKLSSV